MRRGKITKRLDAKWLAFGKPPSWRYPATKFGELTIAEPGYGSGARATTMQTGLEPRYIRITDFDDDGIPDDNEYTTPEVVEADCFLEANDMLFARSGATVGKTYLHQDVSHPAIFAGYCIRFRFDVGKVLPLYAWFFTKTAAFSHWVQTIQRPSGQPNINKQEFKSVELPLPPLVKQRELVDAMETARTARRTKLAEADALLAGLDQYLLDTLGLAPPPDTPRKSFAVNLGAVIGKRLDPPAYQPLISYAESHEIALRDLQELAEIGAHTLDKSTSDDELVPYIGLPECDLTEVREVVMRPYHEVRARSIVRPGDILFARIEPSVFNKKYVLTEDLRGNAFAYTSTEFYVVTPNPDQIETEYLYAMFFCSFVFAQTRGKTTGSSGRRRLDPEMFRTLRIPVPDMATQSVIAAETRRRRERARTLRAEAEQGWAEAKRWFEEQLLGPDA